MAILTMLYAALCGFLALASAHNINLKAHSRECFHEQLHADDKMTVTFQVGDREFGGSGNLDIDFWVRTIHLCSLDSTESCWRSIFNSVLHLHLLLHLIASSGGFRDQRSLATPIQIYTS